MSKYSGETEKSLDRVFAEAAAAAVRLLFDEAAALFGRPGEVQDAEDHYRNEDHYGNMEANHPIHRIEARGGCALLATGLAVMAVLGLCLIQRSRRPK